MIPETVRGMFLVAVLVCLFFILLFVTLKAISEHNNAIRNSFKYLSSAEFDVLLSENEWFVTPFKNIRLSANGLYQLYITGEITQGSLKITVKPDDWTPEVKLHIANIFTAKTNTVETEE